MKRTLSIILILVLLLGVLPAAVHAGGGYQVVWSVDFNSPHTMREWTVLDANDDNYSFINFWTNATEACAASCLAVDGSGVKGANADEYLVSPAIALPSTNREYELTFSYRAIRGDGKTGYTYLRVLVLDANEKLSDDVIGMDARREYASEVCHPSFDWTTVRCDLSSWAGQNIRLVFHHYDEYNNELRLDDFKITEYEPDEHIDRVTVMNVPVPEAGKNVADMKETDISIFESLLTLVPGSLKYYKTVDEQPTLVTDGTFEVGKEYVARIQIKPYEYTFTYTDAIASANGRRAIYHLNNNGTPGDKSDDLIEIEVPFGYLRESVYTVSFFNAHGDDPAAQKVTRGECAEELRDLTSEDFLFLGWFTDPQCTKRYDFSTPVTENLSLFSGWLYTPGGVKQFSDVDDYAKYFYEPVYWAVVNGVTTGTSETRFSPDAPCTRAQVVTFLWRAAGKPEPTSSKNPFVDVAEGQYYSKAVLWAVEQGITKGTSDTTFRPDQTCTRGQIVTFLWRYKGSPAPANPKTAFTDVPEAEYYAKAVAWAVENDVTKGKSATSFAPGDVCTRAQIVTFLFRAVNP